MDIYGKAHYDLDYIQTLLDDPNARIITRKCRNNASSLGYISEEEIVERVKKITKSEIYKTMEVYDDPSLWQDVYRTNDGSLELYIKLKINHDNKGVVIQFKRR